jgi:hypothetical protein
MGKHRERNLYHETTDSRTYRILHITSETGCCLKCAKRRTRNSYGSYSWYRGQQAKMPSWKLVSKNKKQWMKKPLKFKHKRVRAYVNATYCEITW